jgi:hypothetical protein
VGVLLVDAELRVLVANAAAEAMTAGAGAALRLLRTVEIGHEPRLVGRHAPARQPEV